MQNYLRRKQKTRKKYYSSCEKNLKFIKKCEQNRQDNLRVENIKYLSLVSCVKINNLNINRNRKMVCKISLLIEALNF